MKSLDEIIQDTWNTALSIVYDADNIPVDFPEGLEPEYSALWDFIDGIGMYVDLVRTGRMSFTESLKDHVSVIESWVNDINTITFKIKRGGK